MDTIYCRLPLLYWFQLGCLMLAVALASLLLVIVEKRKNERTEENPGD